MSMLNAHRPVAPFGAETLYHLVSAAERALQAAARLRRSRAARIRAAAQLKAMSVTMLDDLGLAGHPVEKTVLRRRR